MMGENVGGANYYFTLDLLGSIREMTNGTGTVAGQLAYDPYGRSNLVQGTSMPDFEFAGCYVHTISGLTITRARLYSSNLGRFISKDPVAEAGGTNLYQYTKNPICFVDPLGTNWMTPIAFQQGTGYPGAAAAIANAGCRGVADSALGIPSAYLPESYIPLQNWPSKCFWGEGNNPDKAAKKASCSQKCPAGSHMVVWCKQGAYANPGDPGSPVQNPAVDLRTLGEDYNYSVWTSNGYQGADEPERVGGQRAYSQMPQPQGGESFPNSACCGTCVPNKGK
jgi:RHS repeat-associated protein